MSNAEKSIMRGLLNCFVSGEITVWILTHNLHISHFEGVNITIILAIWAIIGLTCLFDGWNRL